MPSRNSFPVSLNALHHFEAVARHLNMSRAAEQLGLTHGAVSRQITALEEQIGVPLFARRNNRLALSEAGRALFADVAPAFERLQTALRNAREHASGGSTLLVNVPPTFAMKWLIPRLSSFQRRKPLVEIRLTTGKAPIAEMPLAGFDLVVRRLSAPVPRLDAVRFLSASLVPVCAPELLEQHPVRSAQDLSRHVLLHSNNRAAEWPAWLEASGLAGLRPRSELVFEEIYFALQAALDGMGVALAPLPLAADDIAAGRLSMLFAVRDAGLRDYHHVVSPQSGNRALAQEFGRWLEEQGRESNRFADELVAGLFPSLQARRPATPRRVAAGADRRP